MLVAEIYSMRLNQYFEATIFCSQVATNSRGDPDVQPRRLTTNKIIRIWSGGLHLLYIHTHIIHIGKCAKSGKPATQSTPLRVLNCCDGK